MPNTRRPIDFLSPMTDPSTSRPRVFLCDDHVIIRKGLRDLLAQQDIQVVGEADSLAMAFEQCEDAAPDVVILDLNMDEDYGIHTLDRFIERFPRLSVVVFSMRESIYTIAAAYDAGAKGYVTKAASPHVLLTAIREVAAGNTFFMPGMAEKILVYKANEQKDVDPTKALTKSQLNVFRMMAEGKSYDEIGAILGQSGKAIENRAVRIRKRLNIGQGDLKLLAVKFGIIRLDL